MTCTCIPARKRPVSFRNLIVFFLLFLTFAAMPLKGVQAQTFPGQIGVEVRDRPTGFVDALKDQGRLFVDSNGNAVPTDAYGNPTTDGTLVVFDNRPVPEWLGYSDDPAADQPDCSGTYLITFQGQATLSNVPNGPTLTFGQPTYNAATNTTSISVTLPGGANFTNGAALMQIGFTNTHATSNVNGPSGITNLQIIRPGFTASQVFDPAFVSALSPFSHLRFMDWVGTNTDPGYFGDTGHHLLSWSDRSLPQDLFQGIGTSIRPGAWGVSWEYVLLLANATNKDIWINIPVSATGGSDPLDPTYVASPDTSSYIYNLAYLLKNGDAFTGNKGLNSGLHIYIEHSNEVWNPGFLQYTWNSLAAQSEVSAAGSGTSALNNDGDTNSTDWQDRRHLKRVYEIGQIFQSVFGPGSLNTTIRPVYAWWQMDEGTGSNAANALAWFQKTYGPPKNYFYALAQGDYFPASNYSNDSTVAEVLADMQSTSNASASYVTTNKALAAQYGLPLYTYEGGPDNSNGGTNSTTNIGVEIQANRDPGMNTLVQNHIRTNWFAQGGGTFSYYDLSSAYSRYGSWGATDDYRNLSTAKYEALLSLTGNTGGAPSAPTGLTATAGNNTVGLAWSAVSGASNYNVERGTTAGGENTTTPIATVSTASYTDSSVTNGTTYYYVVTATNSAGTSGASNEASVTPEPSAPPAPTLSGTAGNGQATLAWTTAAGASSYNVYEGTTSGNESATAIATGITGTTYTVGSLTNGSTYYFEVRGVNSFGTGAVSNESAVTPAGAPAAPSGLSAQPGSAQITLTWTAASGATSYNVYQGTSAGGESTTAVATGVTSASTTITGLTNGTKYYFKVSAVNSSGTSGYSNEASATPAAGGTSGTLLATEPFGEASGALNGASGNGDSGWSAAWVEQMSSTATPGYNITSTTPLTYTGLTTTPGYAIGGYVYQNAGRGLNVAQNGPFSAYLSNGLIGAPGQTVWLSFLLRQDANTGETNAVYLNTSNTAWYTAAANNLGIGYFGSASNNSSGTPVWSLQFNGSTTVQSTVPVVVGQTTLLVASVTFTASGQDQVNLYVNPTSLGGAAPSTPTLQYTPANSIAFQGIAYYGGDTTNQSSLGDIRLGSSYAAVTPSGVPAPAAPTNVAATAGNGQATITWTASTGATSYQVYDTTGGNYGPAGAAVTGTSSTITGLTNGTKYTFYVEAINSGGSSGPSGFASATPNVPAPAAPSGLSATAGSSQVALSWTGSAGAVSYNVYQGTTAGGESATPVATGVSGTTYTVTGLTNGTTYDFKVSAVNAGGTSAYSNEASAAPTAGGASSLLAYEPFSEATGAINGASGGGDFGWGAAWIEQYSSNATPGYNIVSTAPLTYSSLVTAGNYGIGGYNYQSAGRQLNLTAGGPFNSYLSNGSIGAPGTTIWISFLMRQDVNPSNGQTNAVYLNPTGGSSAWLTNASNNVGIGYFGSASNNASGSPFWSLQYNGSTTVLTNVPVVQGQTTLFVASVTFGASGGQNQINLYINPTSLGGSAPGTASAKYSTTSSTLFQAISYEGGYSPNESSLDELRVGSSFAAVTPVH